MAKRTGGPPVVIDSSAWIDFLRGAGSPAARETGRLLRSGRARLTGVVLAELLQGAPEEEQRVELAEALRGVEFLPVEREGYERAGMVGAQLRARGETIPTSDLIVAAAALVRGWAILTTDAHFDRVPGLRLHRPGER